MKYLLLAISLMLTNVAFADDNLPVAINCYQSSTNANDIDAYMNCFTEDAIMIDVSRTFTGSEAIKTWALREVIGKGENFQHRSILESEPGFAKTEVQWLSWVVHYFYWWNAQGKITKMSLQYAN